MTPLAPLTPLVFDLPDVVILLGLFVAAALLFLLTGWRLGRESAGQAMFGHPLSGGLRGEPPGAGDDPWQEAMYGPPVPSPASADAWAGNGRPLFASRVRPGQSGTGDGLSDDG